MAEIRTLTTLTKKRDEISRAIGHYEKQLAQARADLAAITAAMAIFQGSPEPGQQRAYVDLKRLFRYGEIAKHCLDCLADGKDWTTRQVAIRLMQSKGLNTGDAVMLKAVATNCLYSLAGLHKRGRIHRTAKRGGKNVWRQS